MPVAVASCSIVRRSSGTCVSVASDTVTANDVTSVNDMFLGVPSAPAGGAPLGQVIGATAAGIALTIALYTVGQLHRSGRTRLLDQLARPFVWLLRVPAWAALPAAIATGAVLIAGLGFYWDVAEHIDNGRDPGPFGTAAHYPILLGLFGLFTAGWLAVVMARGDDAARTGVRLMRGWTAPTSGVAMALCGGFALLGFPTDDVWHEVFGQDVTLWGPTHLILLTGGQLTIVCILGLLVEGRVAVRARGRRGLPGRGRWVIAISGAGGVLAGLTVYQAEFGFGVPQYRLLFEPVLLAFSAGVALVLGRVLAGRGGALAACAFYVVVSAVMAVFVGPVMGRSVPHFPTYVAAAAAVELAGVVFRPAERLRSFAGLSGALVGVVGTLGEWGWSHVWMPIAWPAHFVPSAIASAIVAGVCGALIGVFVAGALAPRRVPRPGGSRAWLPAAGGVLGFAVLLAVLVPTSVPTGSRATVTLIDAGSGRANATVSVHPASLADKADFVQELAWQGHERSVQASLRRVGPGVFRTTEPLPVSGSWKALIRIQKGSTLADMPVYMPADPAIPAPGIAAAPRFERALVSDSQLMQRERKREVPGWLWAVGIGSVLVMIALILLTLGWSLDRVARLAAQSRSQPTDPPESPSRNRQEVTWPDSSQTRSATSSARSAV